MFAEVIQKWRGESLPVALANGFCGDVNNINVHEPPTRKGWEHAQHVARVLATNVVGLIEDMRYEEGGTLRTAREELTIPLRPITDAMRKEARRVLGDRSQHAPADGYSRDEIYARELLLLDEMPRDVTTEVQVIALNGAAFLGCPGEMFVQFAVDLSTSSPLKPLFKIELANDYVGYIPTRKAFEEGSYETWYARSSQLIPEAGDRMMESANRLLASLA
jgi:hypothetical protein